MLPASIAALRCRLQAAALLPAIVDNSLILKLKIELPHPILYDPAAYYNSGTVAYKGDETDGVMIILLKHDDQFKSD